jgi:hypothetical protein
MDHVGFSSMYSLQRREPGDREEGPDEAAMLSDLVDTLLRAKPRTQTPAVQQSNDRRASSLAQDAGPARDAPCTERTGSAVIYCGCDLTYLGSVTCVSYIL